MPSNIIIPVLHYINLDQAIDWLCKCFGFKHRWRVGNHRAQLSYAGGTIAVTEMSDKSKGDFNLQQHSILVRVDNVNKHFENSSSHGVEIIQTPSDLPFGERQYSVRDIGGHLWTFSESIKDVIPEDWGGTSVNLTL